MSRSQPNSKVEEGELARKTLSKIFHRYLICPFTILGSRPLLLYACHIAIHMEIHPKPMRK
jgi:hypothetical protein